MARISSLVRSAYTTLWDAKSWARADCDSSAACRSAGSDSRRMSVTTTSAPARASASESARPSPREPPVTTATLPLRSNITASRSDRPAPIMVTGSPASWRPTWPALLRLLRARGGMGDRGALAEDAAGDHQALDLGRLLPDLVDLGVAHEALHRILLDVPVTTQHLDGVGGDAHRHVPRVQLGHRPLGAGKRDALSDHPARPPDQEPSRVDLGRHVGELEGDGLVPGDGLAEGVALEGVVARELERRPGDAEGPGGDVGSCGLEYHQEPGGTRSRLGAVRLHAQARVLSDEALLEDHLGGMGGPDPHLLLLAPLAHPGVALFDDEAADRRGAEEANRVVHA